MKKKLLLFAVTVIAIISVFAISASADVIYKDADGAELFRYVDEDNDYDFDSYSGTFPKFDSNNNALTWYITATAVDGDDTVHTVESKVTLGEAGSINDSGAYSFTSPVTNKNTVSVNFPDNAGIKTWAFNTFGGNNTRTSNNILFVYCPNTLTEFANNPFQETQVIVAELDFETPITEIPQNFAHEARNLEAINIPDAVKLIKGKSSNEGAPFYNNISLTGVNFTDNTQLEEMYNNVFLNCSSLTEVKLPNSLTKIGERIFWRCYSLETIRLGANLAKNLTEYNVQSLLYECNSLKYVYISGVTVPTSGTHMFFSGASNMVFFYTGNYAQYEAFNAALTRLGNNGKFTSATAIEWDSSKSDQFYKDLAVSDNKNYVVYGYNTCKAFYNDVHQGDDGDCTTADTCTKCNTTFEAKESHNIIANTLVYANGLGSTGVRNYICDNPGCYAVDEINKEYEAIIGAKGYSFKENDKTGLDGGYSINTKLLALYEELNGSVKIGIIIVNAEDAQKNGLVDEGFELISTKGMQVELTSREYSYFDLKITGFNTEALQKLGLIITSYVIDDFDGDGAEEIKYVQHKMSDASEAPVTIGGVVYNTVTVERAYKEKYPDVA